MHEYAVMITGTLIGFPGRSSEELQRLPDCWLNRMAVFSVDRILTEAEKRGYVRCRADSKGVLRYWATAPGVKSYGKYSL